MHQIRNLTNSPYDLDTLDGPVRLPAFGTVRASLTDDDLAAMRGIGLYEITEAAQPAPHGRAKRKDVSNGR